MAREFQLSPEDAGRMTDVFSGSAWRCRPLDPEAILRIASVGGGDPMPWHDVLRIVETVGPEELQERYPDSASYHESRVAWLVNNPPEDPVRIRVEDGSLMVSDGNHRVAAAIVSGRPVSVIVDGDPDIFAEMFPQAEDLTGNDGPS